MVVQSFPPVETADEYGLVAIGGDLEPETLLLAYRSGVFPWPVVDDRLLTWFAPARRAVLFLADAHCPRSLRQEIRRNRYDFCVNRNFPAVITACADCSLRSQEERGTWITAQLIRAYTEFHRAGYCHSVECYEADELIGGLYGVAVGRMFAGESMFHLRPNGSKLALWYLIEYLRERGVPWIDCQQSTELLRRFGAVEIEREEFMKLLARAVDCDTKLF